MKVEQVSTTIKANRQYKWTIVESGIKHNNPAPNTICSQVCCKGINEIYICTISLYVHCYNMHEVTIIVKFSYNWPISQNV